MENRVLLYVRVLCAALVFCLVADFLGFTLIFNQEPIQSSRKVVKVSRDQQRVYHPLPDLNNDSDYEDFLYNKLQLYSVNSIPPIEESPALALSDANDTHTWKVFGFLGPDVLIKKDSYNLTFNQDPFTCELKQDTCAVPNNILSLPSVFQEQAPWQLRNAGACVLQTTPPSDKLKFASPRVGTDNKWSHPQYVWDVNGHMVNKISEMTLGRPEKQGYDYLMIPNGYAALQGTVFNCKARFVSKQMCSWEDVAAGRPIIANLSSPPKDVKVFPRIIYLTQFNAKGFYHFAVETFPMLFSLPDEIIYDPSTYLYLHQNSSFVRAFLDIINFPLSRVIFAQEFPLVQGDMVYMPHSSGCHKSRFFNINRFRALVYKKYGLNPIRSPARQNLIVFIDRGVDHKIPRSIANQAELLQALKLAFPKEKFVVFPPNGTVEQAIQVFHRAKIIIGAHGAGLSNSIFSLAGTGMLEFGLVSRFITCYHDLAGHLGLNYATYFPEDAHWLQGGMHVNIGQTIGFVRQMAHYADLTAYEYPWKKPANITFPPEQRDED